jgi:hypothetical protein
VGRLTPGQHGFATKQRGIPCFRDSSSGFGLAARTFLKIDGGDYEMKLLVDQSPPRSFDYRISITARNSNCNCKGSPRSPFAGAVGKRLDTVRRNTRRIRRDTDSRTGCNMMAAEQSDTMNWDIHSWARTI